MFSKIIALIKGEVTSIETILAGYFKAVKDLEQHAQQKMDEAFGHIQAAAKLQELSQAAQQAAQEAKDTAVQANHIAQQIKNVVTTSANAVAADANAVSAVATSAVNTVETQVAAVEAAAK